MSQEIFNIIGSILGAAFVAILAWVGAKFKEWIATKVDKETQDILYGIIDNFVRAAEELYKEEDPSGIIRKTYVQENLRKLGYLINEEVNAYIESKVFDINLEQKLVDKEEVEE